MRRCGQLARLVSSRLGPKTTTTTTATAAPSLTLQRQFSSATRLARAATTTTSRQAQGATAAARDTASHKSHLDIATDRGAYDERTIPHVACHSIKQVEVVTQGKHVQVTWEDGKVSKYHTLWLRHTCFCPDCKFDGNGQPKLAYDQIPSDLVVSSAVDDGEGCLVVQWEGETDHTGVFPLKWLRFHCYSDESIQELRETIKMRYSNDTTIPRVPFEEVMESDEGVLRWVTILNQRGICIVEGLPLEPGMGRKVCERITRSVIPTIYGFVDDVMPDPIEDVKSSPVPINAGYSTDELKLHQDLVYYASPPGMQALFCLRFDAGIEGGESIFSDMFHIAETFREQHPEDFKVLATVPATLDTIHYKREWPVHMNVKRPMFVLNDHGDLVGVRYQPHHLGPLQVKEEFVEPFYAAYKKFYALTNNWPYKFQYRLQPGEMVSYNNRRMAHGRTAFRYRSGQERHFQGCYLNVSEFKSCMQSLANLVGDGRIAQRVGDYDYM